MKQSSFLAALALATGWLSACGASGPASGPVATPTDITPTESAAGGAPEQLTDLELQIGATGEQTYSGYACVIAPAGCACETPAIQKARFSFTPDNRMQYDFQPLDNDPKQWLLEHAGVNQWSYATPLKDEAGNTQAVVLALLSFTSDGYVLTQAATMGTGEVVTCPDVIFRRLP